MICCDLHTHSCFSDGTCTPEQLLQKAERIGLKAVALCDHNTVAGLPDFMAAAQQGRVEAIPGVEFSTEFKGAELHILGLFIQPRHYETVTGLLEELLRDKERSNRDLVEKLNTAGYALDYEKIKETVSGGYVNRAVIAAELTRMGYVPSIKMAFKTLLSEKNGYYVPPKKMDAYEAIRFIKSIGAVAVLAHPFLNLDEAGLRAFLPKALAFGLDGMETMYPKFTDEETKLAKAIAKEYGLLESGGSDYHGENKPDIQLGVGRGTLQVSSLLLEALRDRAGK